VYFSPHAALADLRWIPGVNLYVAGALAALQLGPDSLNLAGASSAARRLHSVLLDGADGGLVRTPDSAAGTLYPAMPSASRGDHGTNSRERGTRHDGGAGHGGGSSSVAAVKSSGTYRRLLGQDGNTWDLFADDSDGNSVSDVESAGGGDGEA
jgi:hypothetical protein